MDRILDDSDSWDAEMDFKNTILGIVILGALSSLLSKLVQKLLAHLAPDGFFDLAGKALRGFIIGAAVLAGFVIAIPIARALNLGLVSSFLNQIVASGTPARPPETPPAPDPAPPPDNPRPQEPEKHAEAPTGKPEDPSPSPPKPPSPANLPANLDPIRKLTVKVTAQKGDTADIGSGIVVSWSPLNVLTAADLLKGSSALTVSFYSDQARQFPAQAQNGLTDALGIAVLDVGANVAGSTDSVPKYNLNPQENQHIWLWSASGDLTEGAISRLDHGGDNSKIEYTSSLADLPGAPLLDDTGNLIAVRASGAGDRSAYATTLAAFFSFLDQVREPKAVQPAPQFGLPAVPYSRNTPTGSLATIPLAHHYVHGGPARGFLTISPRGFSWYQYGRADRPDNFSAPCSSVEFELKDARQYKFELKVTGLKNYTFIADSQQGLDLAARAYAFNCHH